MENKFQLSKGKLRKSHNYLFQFINAKRNNLQRGLAYVRQVIEKYNIIIHGILHYI